MPPPPDRDPSYQVIGCAIKVHRQLGPGLLESIYETCLCDELASAGLSFARQKSLPVVYKGKSLDGNYQIDIIVEDSLILEIKAVNQLLPIHEAQLQTYLRLSGLKLGLLMNFNATQVKDGIRRVLAGDAASHYVR
jgi:GxxExxY protein